ncbi:MAG TPA: nucleotidyltransferase family protein [Sedimentisphaerales bacterium]|nr:nucleotidyltransferase family protein [Sedimentisphaerales bacterium]
MICAIVLAAGRSSRMGVQKLLLPFGGKTVISHIVDQLLASAVDKIFVVRGHQPHRISGELSGRPVSIVNNADYDSGMLSSVRCGLRALPKRCKAVLVAIGDQPSISTELVDLMIRSFSATEKKILVPCCEGRRGHPILFAALYREEILTHYDDVGLRGLLQVHPDDVFELTVSTSSVLSDMDDPDDYRRELKSMNKNGVHPPGP